MPPDRRSAMNGELAVFDDVGDRTRNDRLAQGRQTGHDDAVEGTFKPEPVNSLQCRGLVISMAIE